MIYFKTKVFMNLLGKEYGKYQHNTAYGEVIIPASFSIPFISLATLLLLSSIVFLCNAYSVYRVV